MPSQKEIIRYVFAIASGTSHWFSSHLLLNNLSTQYQWQDEGLTQFIVPSVSAVIATVCAYSFQGAAIVDDKSSGAFGSHWHWSSKVAFSSYRIADETFLALTNYDALRNLFNMNPHSSPLAKLPWWEYTGIGLLCLIFCGGFIYLTELCSLFGIHHDFQFGPTMEKGLLVLFVIGHTIDHMVGQSSIIGVEHDINTKIEWMLIVFCLNVFFTAIPTYFFEAREAVNYLKSDSCETQLVFPFNSSENRCLMKGSYAIIPASSAVLSGVEFLQPLIIFMLANSKMSLSAFILMAILCTITYSGGVIGNFYSEGSALRDELKDACAWADRNSGDFCLLFGEQGLRNNIQKELVYE